MPPPSDTDTDTTPGPPAPPASPVVSTRFRVTLHCPTPVAHPELDVKADDKAAAWKQFCAANGISDSDHPRTIVPLVSSQ